MKSYRLIILSILGLIIISSTTVAYPKENRVPTANQIWKKLENVNPNLKDYSVDLNVHVKGRYYLLKPQLDVEGVFYFKKPSKNKLELKRGSYFLDKYPNIFGWHLPKLKRFNSKVTEGTLGDRPVYIVSLTPNYKATDLREERFFIDKENYTALRQMYLYAKNGKIVLDIKFRKENGNYLYDMMLARFNFPKDNLSAQALARYGQYKINIGLTDAFFDKKK